MNDCTMLNHIRQNLDMGIDSTQKVIPCAKSPEFKNALESQLSEYRTLYCEAENMLCRNGGEEKNASAFAKLSTDLMTEIKCMTYGSDSEIAEDMIKGTTMGITKLSRYLGEWEHSNSDALNLAKKVIRTEEQNVEQMKKYL